MAVQVRRVLGGVSGIRIHPNVGQSQLGSIAAAGASSAVSADAAVAATSITVASDTFPLAGDFVKIKRLDNF